MFGGQRVLSGILQARKLGLRNTPYSRPVWYRICIKQPFYRTFSTDDRFQLTDTTPNAARASDVVASATSQSKHTRIIPRDIDIAGIISTKNLKFSQPILEAVSD
jgi:hypothetical protein